MNIQEIEIAKDFSILMNTKAKRATENVFKNNYGIQEQVEQFKECIKIIENWGDLYETKNYYQVSSDLAPQTLRGLKEQHGNLGYIYIDDVGSQSCEWNVKTNIALRHRHDIQHIEFNKTMSEKDEKFLALKLALSVLKDCREWNLISKQEQNFAILNIILTDFKAQTEYYSIHRNFVNDQKLFLRTCLFNSFDIFKFSII
jgi:hypothetical protein